MPAAAQPKLLTVPEWKALAAKSEAPADALLRKAYVCEQGEIEKDVKLGDRDIGLIISTESPDRDHDIITADGWQLKNYRKNPIVLYAHDYHGLPVARAKKIMTGEGQLRVIDEFAPADVNPMAETVFQLIKRGFLNAASVGFMPIKWSFNETRVGYDFEETELLEHSIVPVPAHPEALVEARSAGIDLGPLKTWAEATLNWCTGEAGLWLPKKDVERALVVLNGGPAIAAPAAAKEEPAVQTSANAGDPPTPAAEATPPAPEPPAPEPAAVPAAAEPATAGLVFEFDEPQELIFEFDEPEPAETFDFTPEQVREVIESAINNAVGARLTALTGRLD